MKGSVRPACTRLLGAAAVLGVAAALVVQGPARPTPVALAQGAPPPGQTGQPIQRVQNQLVGVTLARGIKATPLFGEGSVTPVDPTTTFINTDLPYAVAKARTLVPDTVVTIRLTDPAGPAFAIEVKVPPHKNTPWEEFDFAVPLYILGTDLEGETGTWHLAILFDGQPENETAFQWGPATPIALSRIKDEVDRTPLSADLHWRYGAALALLHHDREGIQEVESAIRLDGRYALYYITLGRIYEREGRSSDAIRAFRTALTFHGSSYDAVYSGWAQAHLSRLQTH